MIHSDPFPVFNASTWHVTEIKFEELFHLCVNPQERRLFLSLLPNQCQ